MAELPIPVNRLSEAWRELRRAHRRVRLLAAVVGLVGFHSLALGVGIYLFPADFYSTFFAAEIRDPFFLKQAGVFLICLGLFYLVPLIDLRRLHPIVAVSVLTKVLAFLFLVGNAALTPAPALILGTSLGDAGMGLLLALLFLRARPFFHRPVPPFSENDATKPETMF